MAPQVAELLVAELGTFGAVFVLEVDDDAGVGSAEFRTAEAAADHLFVAKVSRFGHIVRRREAGVAEEIGSGLFARQFKL